MTLNSTSMAWPPPAANNVTTGHARAGGVKHQVKPMCQPSVGVGQHGHALAVTTFSTASRARLRRAGPSGRGRALSVDAWVTRGMRELSRVRAVGGWGRKEASPLWGGSLARCL